MASPGKQPEYGDKIWHEGLGSGIITGIEYRSKMVYADYYDKGSRTYEFDELLGTWDDAYGGTWMIYNLF